MSACARRCQGLFFIVVALLFATTAQAAEKLLRASDAGLHHVAAKHTPDGGHGIALQLATPDGQSLELSLQTRLALTRDARAHVAQVRDGSTQVLEGTVAGRDGSWVRLTRIGSGWLGAVHDGEQIWFLDPASHHPATASRMGLDHDATLVYSLADLSEPLDFHGDTPSVPWPAPDALAPDSLAARTPATPMAPLATAGNGGYELQITLVMDTEFQALYPDSASVAVAILNVVDGFYAADFDTRIRLHHLVALTDNGPLTMTAYVSLYETFRQFVQETGIPFHGVAHLLSGRVFDTSVIGYAGLNVLCKPELGYGINQATLAGGGNATLVAHELGHNFGFQHDNTVRLQLGITSAFVAQQCNFPSFIMYPSIAADPATEFSPCSTIYFNYFEPPNQACLQPVGLPFSDGFDIRVLPFP